MTAKKTKRREAKVQIANYGGESLKGKKLIWKLDYAPDGHPDDAVSSGPAASIGRFNQPSPLAQGEIPIAAISTLQTPLLHPAEWRNFQQVPKLSFFSPHFAL